MKAFHDRLIPSPEKAVPHTVKVESQVVKIKSDPEAQGNPVPSLAEDKHDDGMPSIGNSESGNE